MQEIAGDAAPGLLAFQLIAVEICQRDRQRWRDDPLGFDDRQARHSGPTDLDAIHPDRTLFELCPIGFTELTTGAA